MVLCICKAVSDKEVNAAIADGARSIDAVARATGAGSDCGCCHEAIEKKIDRACSKAASERCAGCPSLMAGAMAAAPA